ncbi:Pentatricopeptide repeat [Dillenia turbinata]|uniref:Pentatricopeptide repeat n=1 Tax=Dillenia turbinata TaxID=194707 RepID=A0AAN8W674_9MAGN
MRRFARTQKVEEAIYAFNVMAKYDLVPNLAAFNGLLSALCKAKNVRNAQEIFELRDRLSPMSKLLVFCLTGGGERPIFPSVIFGEMVDVGCSPDVVTYKIMVNVLCKAGRIGEALEVVKEMDSSGCKATLFIYSVLVHTYGVENRIEDAVDTFFYMEIVGIEDDVVVYNALIGAFCSVKKIKNVYRVLKDMDCKGVKPNSKTLNIVLNSLIDEEYTNEAFRFFRKMVKVCQPDADTYTVMINVFCKRNELNTALKMWKYMGLKEFFPSMHTFSVLIDGLYEGSNTSKACMLLEDMIEKGIPPPL